MYFSKQTPVTVGTFVWLVKYLFGIPLCKYPCECCGTYLEAIGQRAPSSIPYIPTTYYRCPSCGAESLEGD